MQQPRFTEDNTLRLNEDGSVSRILEQEVALTADPTLDAKPLLLVRSFLDTGTEYTSDIAVRHPSRFYEPRLLTMGTLERGIPIPAGPPVIGSGNIEISDTPDESGIQHWRRTLHQITQRRRKIEIKTGWEFQTEEGFARIYVGELQRATFPPDRVRIDFGDLWQRWLGRQIPSLGSRTNFPNLPEGIDEFFFPLVFGQARIPLRIADATTFDYAANQTQTKAITAVYRQLPDADPAVLSLVDPGEYSLVEIVRTIDSVEYHLNFVRFGSAQPEGTILECDLDGTSLRGEWGPLPTISDSTIRNIVDHVINLVFYMFLLEPAVLDYNMDSFLETWQQYEDLGVLFDGAIVEPMTFGSALAQMMQSSNLHMFQNRNGQIEVRLITVEDPDRPVFTETDDILGYSGTSGSRSAVEITPMQPEQTINRFRYRYEKNFATGLCMHNHTLNNEDDQAELGKIEDDDGDIELVFVKDPATAEWAVNLRAGYFTLRSYHVELSLDAPRYTDKIDLARTFGVTYYGGIGGPWENKEFICYSLNYLWDQMRLVLRGVLRADALVPVVEPPPPPPPPPPPEEPPTPGVGEEFNLMVQLEMSDSPFHSSSTTATSFTRTRMAFDPDDYDGATLYFEVVAQNVNLGTEYAITLETDSGSAVKTVAIPAGTTVRTRIRSSAFTLAAGVYQVKLPQTASDADLAVKCVRIIVSQVAATKTRIQIPLGQGGSTSKLDNGTSWGGAPFGQTIFAAMPQGAIFLKEEGRFSEIKAGQSWTLETVGDCSSSSQLHVVALFNKTTNTQVGSVENHHAFNGYYGGLDYESYDFANDEEGFTNGDEFEVRSKVTDHFAAGQLYAARLYVRLENLERAAAYLRVGGIQGSTTAVSGSEIPAEFRTRVGGDFTSTGFTPTFYFESTGREQTAGDIKTRLVHASDDSTVAGTTVVTGSELNFSGTKSRQRSGELTLADARFLVEYARPTNGAIEDQGSVIIAYIVAATP